MEKLPEQVAALLTGAAPFTREAAASLRNADHAAIPASDKPAPQQLQPDKMTRPSIDLER